MAAGILLAPAFAAAGAIVGAAGAHPEDETRAAIAAIEQVYNDAAVAPGLGGMVSERLAEQGFPADLPCPDPALRLTSSRGSRDPTPTTQGCEPGRPKNLLRLEVVYDFQTRGFLSPDLYLDIDVAAMAVNSNRQRPTIAFHWFYRTPKVDFFAATAADAAALRREMAKVQRQLAERIVVDLVTTRDAAHLTGTFSPRAPGLNFTLTEEYVAGTVQRLPPASGRSVNPPDPRSMTVSMHVSPEMLQE